jgi:hypothetical protein
MSAGPSLAAAVRVQDFISERCVERGQGAFSDTASSRRYVEAQIPPCFPRALRSRKRGPGSPTPPAKGWHRLKAGAGLFR